MAGPQLDQAVITWSGFPGAPGYSVFYAIHGTTGHLDIINAWFTAQRNLIPINVKVTFPSSGRVIDASNGDQVNVWSATPPPTNQGTETGKYSAPTGIVTTWNTSTIHFGKMVKGRTFTVPVAGLVFDTDGSLTTTYRQNFQDAANALVASSDEAMCIWSRPRTDKPGFPDNGASCPITSAVVPDKAAVLRSRRP